MLSSDPSLARKQTSDPGSWRRWLFTFLRLGVGIGLLVYLAESGLIHGRDLARLFLNAWPLTLTALVLVMLHLVLIAKRLSMLFRPQGLKLSFASSFRLAVVGLFFEIFMPGAVGGTVAKLFYAMRENEGRRTQVATVVLFDRIIGIFSLIVLPLFFAPLFYQLVSRVHALHTILIIYAAAASFLMVAFLACLWRGSDVNRLARATHYRPLQDVFSRALETVGGYKDSHATLFSAFGLSLVGNLSIVGVIALGVQVVHPASVAWRLCLIVPIGQLVNSIPLTPGGLGVGEVAFNTLFRLSGLSGGVEAVLCWRIWSALASVLGLYFYLRGIERNIVTAGAPGDEAPFAKQTRRGVPPEPQNGTGNSLAR